MPLQLAHSSPPPSATNMSTPKKTKSSVLPGPTEATNVTSSDSDHFAGHRFTLASVAALHSSSFVSSYSNSERQAAARVLLRHDSHLDGTHYHTRTPAGLHPSYIAFNEALTSPDKRMITHEEFVEATLQDIFDAVCVQDHLDRGISLLIRCPGSHATSTLSAEHIAVDLYVTPRELHEVRERIAGDVSVLVQAFSAAVLRAFKLLIAVHPAAQVNPTGPHVLPAPLVPSGSCIQCSACPSKAFGHDFETHAATKSKNSSSAHQQSTVVQHTIVLALGASTVPVGSPKARQHRYANLFSVPKNINDSTTTSDGPKQRTSGFTYPDLPRRFPSDGSPIISIGPHTDAMLDRFKMGDEVILKLRELMSTVRSSHWEAVLRSQKWEFTFEQAANLAKALNADLQLQKLDVNPKTILASNHKSVRRVQHELYMGQSLLRYKRSKSNPWNTFCWKKNQSVDKENGLSGKALLPELINEHRMEYHALSNDEKDSLLKEYEEHRATKTNGVRISMKSKINDITQTIKAIENELNSLKCRTGAETILYTMRGSTDLPLGGITFATEGVDDFMASVMNIDNQEFVTKMEGFALRGAAKNHQQRCSDLRGKIRHLINHKLFEGWPDGIPFDNLSNVASGITALEDLKERWKSGETAWRQLDEKEFQELDQERNGQLGSGEVVEHRCRPRSDKGKKWCCALSPVENATSRPRKKAYTSPATVESEGEMDGTPVSSPTNTTLDTEPRNDAPVLPAGQPELGGTSFDGSGSVSFQPSALTGANGSFDLFYPFTQTSADGLYLPSSSGNTGFVDSQLPDFNYEQAIMSLNQLLGGPALTP
ncbi:hypothetical protein EV702DRAFT_1202186 [Suillus placidus]|uniref:Uncharacterized protein n=1 Tax=Suillus placidus TaxID=48579 RepID=A0A9P6ZL84_9AGAM|nr:hypothetical protein EV702DRAFT_1202186 [Suillus placidus]